MFMVSDSNTGKAKDEIVITVAEKGNSVLDAVVKKDKILAKTGEEVVLDASGSSDADGE